MEDYMIEEKKIIKPKQHTIFMDNRQKLNISGVIDVGSFNDAVVIVETEAGLLEVKGKNLHMSRLNLENSEMSIDGYVNSLEYKDKTNRGNKDSTNFITKLFK
jgi:sporulation protein YabP